MTRTSIIALSGPSSSGKTTLARLLQRIFGHININHNNKNESSSISTFIIHEDDFYHPDNKIPYTTTKSGAYIQDWDCVEALDIAFLVSALQYVHEHGHLPPRLRSKEDLNDVSPNSGVGNELIDELKIYVAERLKSIFPLSRSGSESEGDGVGRGTGYTLAILEGFLLYAPSPPPSGHSHDRDGDGAKHVLAPVHDLLDVRLFLSAPYHLVKERREKRSGYVTIGPAPTPEGPQWSVASTSETNKGNEGGEEVDLLAEDDRPPPNFWTDPPGYVDDIVWPRYVRDHAWLLLSEDAGAESQPLPSIGDTDELIRKVGQGINLRTDVGVTVAPGQGALPMADLLKWAVEEVLNHLEQNSRGLNT